MRERNRRANGVAIGVLNEGGDQEWRLLRLFLGLERHYKRYHTISDFLGRVYLISHSIKPENKNVARSQVSGGWLFYLPPETLALGAGMGRTS